MSHLRNLLHRPLGEGSGPLRPSMAAAAVAAAVTPEPEIHLASALAIFPVVQARIGPENRLIFQTDPHSSAADRFRYLRMRLREPWSAGRLRRLLVTSPLAHDGKSTLLLNLATALSERGKRTVLVIEADLHHPTISETLGLSPWTGLSDCLQDDSIPPLSAIRRVEPLGWHLLPAGEPRRNPTELLQSQVLGNIIKLLTPNFDWILIDSPPAIALTDALALQQHADGSLLIVRAGQTPREAVERAVTLLGKQNLVGIVLNAVEDGDDLYYQYRYGRADGEVKER
jgi:succinoglycan biosynthesis transport protein ExoP